MKTSILKFVPILFVSLSINLLAQPVTEINTNFYLQGGVAGGFFPNSKKPLLIPQAGFDATFGVIGYRTNAQIFNTSPDFNINKYITPIKSVLTVSNLKESNSNVLLGITPYLNFGESLISIQPGISIKYLIQKGASANATYYKANNTSILKFPDGNASRNLFMIEPNIRISLGKLGDIFRFYVEAGYNFPLGKNEYNYLARDLTGVVDPRGSVNDKILLESKQVKGSEKLITEFASISAGLQIKLFSDKKEDKKTVKQPREPFKDKIQEKITQDEELFEIYEIKPLTLIVKGAERSKKNVNTVEFSWIALNTRNCGPIQYEFTINEIVDLTRYDPNSDPPILLLPERLIYREILTEKDLSIGGSNILKHTITKSELPNLFEKGKQFEWQVRALDARGNFPQCAWGGNDVIKSSYQSYDCGIKAIVDTVFCSPKPPQQQPGYVYYDIKFRIHNSSDPSTCNNNAIFNGNTPYPNGSNIKVTDINNQTIPNMYISNNNPLQGLTLPIGQTSPQYSITIGLPSNSNINAVRLHAWPTYNQDPAYGAAYADKTLPVCGCKWCDGVKINIDSPVNPPLQIISQSGYDVISFPLSISYSPYKVKRIVAEIVAFDHTVNTNTCLSCNHNNRMHGVFVGNAQNHIVGNQGLWINSGQSSFYPHNNDFSREATWETNSQDGILLNNQIIKFNVGVPKQNHLICCQDRIRATFRFSFVSIDPITGECRVCEVTRSYCIVRKGTIKPLNLDCRDLSADPNLPYLEPITPASPK